MPREMRDALQQAQPAANTAVAAAQPSIGQAAAVTAAQSSTDQSAAVAAAQSLIGQTAAAAVIDLTDDDEQVAKRQCV